MKIKYAPIIMFILFFIVGCESGFDKSLISNVEKLVSPNGECTHYCYHMDSPMAFGSGFSVINILVPDETFDSTDRDILRFGNAYPFWIKWIDDCIVQLV